MTKISPDQLKLIREPWVNVTPALMQHGVNIFYAFFKKYPENLQFFPKFHGVDVEKIKVTPKNVISFEYWYKYISYRISLLFTCMV